jgi:hypothetical protein
MILLQRILFSIVSGFWLVTGALAISGIVDLGFGSADAAMSTQKGPLPGSNSHPARHGDRNGPPPTSHGRIAYRISIAILPPS